MINKEVFFNDHTINIFTDASVRNHPDTTESIAGAMAVLPSIPVNPENAIQSKLYTRLIGSTNNEGEVYAIYLGLVIAIYLKKFNEYKDYTVNLFSDSNISLIGLREWYLGWIKNSTDSDVLINSSNQPVKNQEIFLKCMNLIITNNLHINLYHLRGHIDPSLPKDTNKFLLDFVGSNHLKDRPSRELITSLSEFNNMVDYNTRLMLLPEGAMYQIPTITINNKYTSEHYTGLEVKPAFLFSNDMNSLIKEKKRYASLIKLDDISK